MKRIVLVTILILIIIAPLMLTLIRQSAKQPEFSDNTAIEWNKTYGGPLFDTGKSLIQTSDGGYAIAGSIWFEEAVYSDFWLIKTDAEGKMQWNKSYGERLFEIGESIIQTNDGGYAIGVYTKSYGAGDGDYWLIKTDENGNMFWNKTYGGKIVDWVMSLIQTNDGGYALAGYTESFGAGGGDIWLVKTDENGTMLWNKTYGGIGYDKAYSIIQTSDGGYIMAGHTQSFDIRYGDFWVVKTDENGEVMWSKAYGGESYDVGYSIAQTTEGGYIIGGYTMSFGAGSYDFWLIKTAPNGNAIWNRTYGGSETERAYSAIQTNDRGYVIAGYTESLGAGGGDCWIVKTDEDGKEEWSKAYGGENDDWIMKVIQTEDGGYATIGYTKSSGAGNADVWLVKLAPEHDLAVIEVTPSEVAVNQGSILNVNATVENLGVYTETFNITLYANSTEIQTETVRLTARNITTITFTWNTSGYDLGNYTLSAYITPLDSEMKTANNNLTDGEVAVIPEYRLILVLPPTMMATLLATIACKKKPP